MALVHDGRELAFLPIRLNDWVAEVQEPAQQAVLERLTPDYSTHFIRCLALVNRLRTQGRTDHLPLTERIFQLLRTDVSRPSLLAAIRSPDRHVRRLAFRILAGMPGDGQVAMLKESLNSDDMAIRLWAAQELRKHLTGEALRELLQRLLTDRFVPIRREALYGFAEQFPELAAERLLTALADERRSIREVARFYLHQSGTTDFAALYRDWLKRDANGITGVIAGLAETGTSEDAPTLAQFASHPIARVRRASIRGLGRLDPDTFGDTITNALLDTSPTVGNAARDVVLAKMHLVAPDRILEMFQKAGESQRQFVLLPIMASMRGWDSGYLLVMAVSTGEEPVKAKATACLWHWVRGSGVLLNRPTLEQASLLDDALVRCGGAMEQALRDALTSLLAYARKEYLGI